MNLLKDLKKQYNEKKKQESAIAQLRKRSKDSQARPRAEQNITTKNPELQRI
jgi:Zn-dependent metalloprotease